MDGKFTQTADSWLFSFVAADKNRAACILLNRHGFPLNTSDLPVCGNGTIIHVISYRHHKSLCNITEDSALSSVIQTKLQEMCSMQEKCKHSHLPNSNLEENDVYVISATYECIDKKRLVDMCENVTKRFKGILHLTAKERTLLSASSCSCFISELNRSSFSMMINDIVLWEKDGGCSDALIYINSKLVACDIMSDNNTLFQQRFGKKEERNIHILIKSNTTAPRRVWFSFEAKGDSVLELVCKAHPRPKISKALHSAIMTMEKNEGIDNENTTSTIREEMEKTNVILVLTSLTGITVVMILVAVRCHTCNKKKKKRKRHVPSNRQKLATDKKLHIEEKLSDGRKRSSKGKSGSGKVNETNETPQKDSKIYEVLDENEYDSSKHDTVGQTGKNTYDHLLFR